MVSGSVSENISWFEMKWSAPLRFVASCDVYFKVNIYIFRRPVTPSHVLRIPHIGHLSYVLCYTHAIVNKRGKSFSSISTSVYKTSKGDIHIPSQDHFIHLLGVYDVHIVLVEVWVHLLSGFCIERYWLRSWLRCILFVNLDIMSSLQFSMEINVLTSFYFVCELWHYAFFVIPNGYWHVGFFLFCL